MSFCGFSQWNLAVSSRVEKDGKGLGGASIVLLQAGKIIKTQQSDGDGYFSIDVPANGDYMIEVSYPQCNMKKFQVITRGVPAEIVDESFAPSYKIGGFTMKPPLPGIDYSALKNPVVKILFINRISKFDHEEAHTEMMLGALGRIRDAEEALIKKQLDLAKTGDQQLKKNDCAAAKASYEESVKTIPVSPYQDYPKSQIEKCNGCLAEKDNEAKKAAEKIAAEKAAANKKAQEEARKAEEERLAKEKAEKDKQAIELKKEEDKKLAAQKAEQERIAGEKAQKDKEAADKAAAEKKAADEKLAKEKAEKEKRDAELKKEEEKKLADKKAEEQRLANEKAEKEKAAAADAKKAEDKKLADKKAEEDRLAKEKAEKEKVASDLKKAEDRKLADKKAEEDRIAKEKADKEQAVAAEAKKAEDKKLADKKAEDDRMAKEKADKEKAAKKENEEKDRKAEAEKNAAAIAEKKKQDAEDAIKRKAEEQKIAADKKAEAERLAKEKAERERKEKENKVPEQKKTDEKPATAVVKTETKSAATAAPKSPVEIKGSDPVVAKKDVGSNKAKYSIPRVLGMDPYKTAITRGDELFKSKRYDEAKEVYEAALGVRPGDTYATGKIEEINKLSQFSK